MNPNLNRDECYLRIANKIFTPMQPVESAIAPDPDVLPKMERKLFREFTSITQAKAFGRREKLKVVTRG